MTENAASNPPSLPVHPLASSAPADRAQAEYEKAVWTLSDGDTASRAEAARVMRLFGPRAVERLCAALNDRDLSVRATVAASLGEIGDPHAVEPLIAALRNCFHKRSARLYVLAGVAGVVSLAVMLAGFLVGSFRLKYFGGFSGFWCIGIGVLRAVSERRGRSKLCLSIAEALVRIAERNPTREVRGVVPDLNAMAVDLVQQEPATRAASRDAARRIEAATERLKDLPLPSSERETEAGDLPRAAEAPGPAPEILPRVEEAGVITAFTE